jgi:hypothetical protein
MGPSSPSLSHLALFPDRQVALVGGELILTVIARDLAGATVTGVVPTYTSSNTGVVLADPGGLLRPVGVGTATIHATAGGQTAQALVHVGAATYDIGALGPPRILNANYIDLSKIGRISRFRSTAGHSFTNDTGDETCRSMKHYFEPMLSLDWTTVDIYAPATGTIWGVVGEPIGFQIRLRPRDVPAMDVTIFHVSPDAGIVRGSWIEAGGRLGRHASRSTSSDIAMSIGPKQGGTLFSYFEGMTDGVFAEYLGRGVPSREAAIITREERDADPVPCVGEQQFTVHGILPDWLVLK